jgi:hypothetical protein
MDLFCGRSLITSLTVIWFQTCQDKALKPLAGLRPATLFVVNLLDNFSQLSNVTNYCGLFETSVRENNGNAHA